MPTAPTNTAPSAQGPGAPAGGEARPAATFRAGDVIHHGPSDEDWMLAADERNGEVICAGWPESIAKASDCRLVRVATDEGRIEMLKNAVATGGTRGSWARDDLRRSGIEAPPARQGSLFE